MRSTHCKAKAKNSWRKVPPITSRTWLAEAQALDEAGQGWWLWPSPEQQQDFECAFVLGGGGMLKRQPTGRWRGFSSHRPSAPA